MFLFTGSDCASAAEAERMILRWIVLQFQNITDMTTLRVIWRFRGREPNIAQRPRRGLTEHSHSLHGGFTEDSQRTRRGLTEDAQRTHRGLAEDSQRTHRLTEDSQRARRGPTQRIHKGFAENLPSEAVLDTGFNEILSA